MSRVIFFYFSASQFNVFIHFSRSPLLDTFFVTLFVKKLVLILELHVSKTNNKSLLFNGIMISPTPDP